MTQHEINSLVRPYLLRKKREQRRKNLKWTLVALVLCTLAVLDLGVLLSLLFLHSF